MSFGPSTLMTHGFLAVKLGQETQDRAMADSKLWAERQTIRTAQSSVKAAVQ